MQEKIDLFLPNVKFFLNYLDITKIITIFAFINVQTICTSSPREYIPNRIQTMGFVGVVIITINIVT